MPIEDLISKIILKMSSDESVLTPEFIKLDAIGIVNNLLPEKSKEKYLKAYNDFDKWKAVKGVKSVSESVLLVYFEYLSTEPVFLSRIRCEK